MRRGHSLGLAIIEARHEGLDLTLEPFGGLRATLTPPALPRQ
ncbi:hypothetical protein ACFVXG_24580 [Kitasatospora sp. NPDC058162]